MDQNTASVIEKLATAVGKSSGDIVQYYTAWFIVDSIVWMLIGAVVVFLGTRIKRGEKEFRDEFWDFFPIEVVKWAAIAIGFVILCANLVDLLAPQGIAIHQLIKDLRG